MKFDSVKRAYLINDFPSNTPLLYLRTKSLPRNALVEIESYCHVRKDEMIKNHCYQDKGVFIQTLSIYKNDDEESKSSEADTVY